MITYLLKSGIVLLFMYGLYWCFLRKEKLFVFSRFFLLASIIFSLAVPLVSIPVNFQVPFTGYDFSAAHGNPVQSVNTGNDTAGTIIRNEDISEELSAVINLSSVLTGTYAVVSVLFLMRFLRNLYKIRRKRRLSEKMNFGKYEIVLTHEESGPCCFLKSIFLNRDAYQNNRIDQELINHEVGHARQLHTIDVLFIELLKIFFWFNPVLFLYDRAIRINHEFLADKAVADMNFDLSAYAHKLVNLETISSSIPLTSSSNYKFTKNRIFMLTKSNPGKLLAGIRILSTLSLMLPVLLLLSFQNQGREVRGFILNKYGKHLPHAVINVTGQKNKVTSDEMGHFVLKSVPENAPITVSAEKYVSRTLTPVFTSEMVIRLQPDVTLEELKKNSAEFFPAPGSRPLIVINGVAEEKLSMADIDPANKVASLRVLTGDEAVKRFGEKAKKGAVEIITEPNTASKLLPYPPADSPEFKEKTLVLIDGKVYTGDIKDIPNDGTKSMYVGNYTPEYDRYGFKGKEKVIEFRTK